MTQFSNLLVALGIECLWPWPPGSATAWLRRRGLDRARLRRFGVGALVVAVPVNLVLGGQLDGHLVYQGDFKTYYFGATVGLTHGWSRIYDLDLQAAAAGAIGPRVALLPFLNTPVVAWITAPLALLPYEAAFAIWVLLMLAAAAVTVLVLARAPGPRFVLGAATLAMWVVVYSLSSGQNALLEALAVVLCWRLLRDGRQGWAGVALLLLAVRPNAIFMLPLAVLAAGYTRAFVVASAGLAMVAAASLWSLGGDGVRQFLALAQFVGQTHPHAYDLTLRHIFGPGVIAPAAGLALALPALWLARRAGPSRPAAVIVLGVLASLFLTPYIHVQDYVALLAALAVLAAESLWSADAPAPAWAGIWIAALVALAPPAYFLGWDWEGTLVIVELAGLAYLFRSLRPAAAVPRPR